jgi:hypothetical protein
LKIAFDENVPIALVRAFRTFAAERQFKRTLGQFEIESAKDYTPNVDDPDYVKNNDVPWIKRFAKAGGKVIVSGNTKMKYVPHERLALIDAGMIVFFFDGQWNNWTFFRKCSLLIHWWPEIAKKVKRVKPPCFWHIPLSWHERSKLRKSSTDDPKKLKMERQIRAQKIVRRARKKASEKPIQPDLFERAAGHAEKK